jgi:MFS family permease
VLHLPAAAAVGVLFASGLANGLINPSLHAIVTLRIPPALRGTVMTSLMTLYALAMPIGILGAGPLLDAFGVDPVFAAAAAVQTLTMAGVAAAALRAGRPEPPQGLGPPDWDELHAHDPDDRRTADVAGAVDRDHAQNVTALL